MAGTVKEILVAVGERVNAGAEIVIIESMKMEIPIESPGSGVVVEIVTPPPSRIDEGEPILRLEV
jgi:acetyl-CoA carboxylase biotin carboxyl carrier protein